MRGLAAVEVLAVWERAGTCPAARRPAELLAAVIPDGAWDLPLGARDAALLRLFAATFGDRLDALSTCPSCGTVVDLTLSCAELAHGGPGAAAEPVRADGYLVQWRPPTGADLLAVAGAGSPGEAALGLLRRCVSRAERDGRTVDPAELPGPVRLAVGAAMARADPLAEITLDLGCPHCARHWSGVLDVAGFVWRRLDRAARALLREVHVLASAYGWTEGQILALSPYRRASYLRLVRDG